MTHLTREELERWWEQGRTGGPERIVGHLAECDECGALYGEVIHRRPLSAGAAIAGPPGLVARGYRAYKGARSGFGSFRSAKVLTGLAAAAVLLIAVVTPVLRRAAPPVAPVQEGIRGTSLQPLAPIGAVDPPIRFRWASPVKAVRFVVEVRDQERGLLFVLSSEAEAVALPLERLGELTRGRTYMWQVVALDANRDEIARTPAQTFAVSPARH